MRIYFVNMPRKPQAQKVQPQKVVAHEKMSLNELRAMAETRGIMWGGLGIQQLVKKINKYN